MTLLVMVAVQIAGMVSMRIAGDFIFFGAMRQTVGFQQPLIATPAAEVLGGIAGGVFSRVMLSVGITPARMVAAGTGMWADQFLRR